MGFLGGSVGKESTCNVQNEGLIPGLGRSSGEEHVNPLQDSCLENPLDRGAWWSIVHRVAKNRDQSDLADTQAYGSAQYLVSGTQ